MKPCFTHVKAISRVFSKIEAINTPYLFLSSTYKCNFLGADNKQ